MKITIAIPTKDRPQVIGFSVARVLGQSYKNIELIVADNSNDQSTRMVLSEIRDERLRYLRTGNLSMAENWDHAIASATGDLVYIIADKLLLESNAIQRLVEFAKLEKTNVFTFSGNPRGIGLGEKAGWQKYKTADILRPALAADISQFQKFGFHGYSLVIAKTLLEKIRTNHQKVITPLSPDYTLAFIVALSTEEFYHLDWCPFRYAENYASNGFSSAYQGPLYKRFLVENKMTVEETYAFAPIKVRTIWNTVVSDFFRVYERTGHQIDHNNINFTEYWKRLFSELVYYRNLTHIDMSTEFRTLFAELETRPEIQSRDIHDFIEQNRLITITEASSATRKSIFSRARSRLSRILR